MDTLQDKELIDLAQNGETKAFADLRFAASVAAFGQILRQDPYTGDFSYDAVIELAEPARAKDSFGLRSEFLNLVRLAKSARDM